MHVEHGTCDRPVPSSLCGDCVRLMTVLVMRFLVSNFSILTENFLYRSPAQVIY